MTSGDVDCPVYDFGPFRLDPGERLLVRNGQSIPLTPKAFDLLVYLVERHGRLAEKQALMSALWPDTIVEEANLAFHVSALRKVLDEEGERESMIQTVPTKGYRFVAPVTVATPIAGPVQAPKRYPWWRWRVLWAGGAIAMVLGAVILMDRLKHQSRGAAAPAADISPNRLHLRKLTDNDQATDVAISPDGRYVAFVRDEEQSQSLWLRQIETRTEVKILPSQGVGIAGLRFSPDSSLLYFIKSHQHDPFAGSLYSMSILGGAARLLIDDIKSPISFSPEGQRFAYEYCSSDGLQLRVARVDRDEQRQLATILKEGCRPFSKFKYGPSWSPDGRTIVDPIVVRDSPTQQRSILISVSADEGTVRELYSTVYWLGRPVWLPGGHSLLVPHSEEDFREPQLWIVTFPDGQAHRVTDDLTWYDLALDATPDGRNAVSIVSTRISNIWVVPVDDPLQARQVSDGLPVAEAMELANGRILANDYEDVALSSSQLWTIDRNGGQRTPFTTLRDVNAFMRCGNVVVAAVDDPGHVPTVTYFGINADGSHAVPLTKGTYGMPACSDIGDDFYYLDQDRILRVPMSGGPPREVGHNRSVGVHWPLGVSPDGAQLAYLQHSQGIGSSEGWKVAVVRTDDGSPVRSWPVQLPRYHPRRFRWSPKGLAWQFLRSDGGGFNVWEQPIAGGPAKQLTRFTSGRIFNFYESLDGKRLVMTRGSLSHDVVLLTFK